MLQTKVFTKSINLAINSILKKYCNIFFYQYFKFVIFFADAMSKTLRYFANYLDKVVRIVCSMRQYLNCGIMFIFYMWIVLKLPYPKTNFFNIALHEYLKPTFVGKISNWFLLLEHRLKEHGRGKFNIILLIFSIEKWRWFRYYWAYSAN